MTTPPLVFIDGDQGTTGLQIHERLRGRTDLQLLTLRQLHACGPVMNLARKPDYWLQKPGAPWPALADERPVGRTLPYEEALRAWD